MNDVMAFQLATAEIIIKLGTPQCMTNEWNIF